MKPVNTSTSRISPNAMSVRPKTVEPIVIDFEGASTNEIWVPAFYGSPASDVTYDWELTHEDELPGELRRA